MTNQLFTWPSVRPERLPERLPSFEALERETREAARAEGLAEGRSQAEAELRGRIKELQQYRQSMEQYRLALDAQQIQEIVEFIRGAFATLLCTTLHVDPEVFRSIVQQAIDALPPSEKLSVRAHPDLARSLSQLLEEPVIEDVSLTPFCVQVESGRVGWSADLISEFNCLLEQGLSIER